VNNGSVLILGARSDIGLAVARAFAARGHAIQLALRDAARAEPDRSDIALRFGVAVSLHECDVLDTAAHAAFIDSLPALPQIAVCAIGLLGDQEANRQDPALAARILRSNFEAPAAMLERLAERFEARGSGTIVGISSVAGDRGRASNYVYGAAKAGFSAYLSGLRNRLSNSGVRVVTVKPGFVRTAMTAGMTLSPLLTVGPEAVAQRIVAASSGGSEVIYVKRLWWLVMAIIRAIPEPIFKKLRI
jgi:decaprenylphospho-beta-D-erythro-pentofuranosid-2-ulose 2-reductase